MKRKNDKGVAIVEFAYVLPLLVILLLGIMEMGFLLYDTAVITNAGREGARAGIVAQDRSNTAAIDADIQATVNNYCQNRMISYGSKNITTIVTWPASLTFGNPLEVNVTYNHWFLVFPNMSSFTNPLTIDTKTVMLLE